MPAADGKAAGTGDEALPPRCVTARQVPSKMPVLLAPPLALLWVVSGLEAPIAKSASAGPKTTLKRPTRKKMNGFGGDWICSLCPHVCNSEPAREHCNDIDGTRDQLASSESNVSSI
jgi:hypothetical protein